MGHLVLELDDAQLVARARAGERGAFEALVRRHTGPLLGHARALLGSAPEAEDLVQEALLRAWRALPREPRDPGAFAAWAHTILHRAGLDLLRARRPHAALDEEPEGEPAPAPPFERREGLDEALAELPPRQRAALHCCYALGLDAAGAAARLDTTPGNVRVLLHRALTALRRRLA